MSQAIINAETIAEVTIETASRLRSESAIKRAIRELKEANGYAGKRMPVVYSCEFPHASAPDEDFIFVNDFGNGTKGQYSIEIKRAAK